LSEREKHGALVDTKLLAGVYLELQGGRERGFDLSINGARTSAQAGAAVARDYGPRPRPLAARLTEAEHILHAAFIRDALKDAAVWLQFEDLSLAT
ncbi:MAG TPA: DNA polymerase III subunit epsilon, partial [Caulobacteraceae bacterium]|nr:DNA polymerase III subunit epsilon [Caulobacteraceae bacterium]